ncbi:MAG: phosphoenolpyruvate--protein phosphotransferase [Leptospirales bacterium]|nr:phosphoenolpyruvate--protein phosphotransferase [Leptospirales bacterium]
MGKRIKKGIIASPGIKIGKAIVFHGDEVKIPKYHIEEDQLVDEINRFVGAVEKTAREIIEIQEKIANESFTDLAEIFSTHLMAVEDPIFIARVRQKIIEEKRNSEWVINDISIELITTLSKIEDEYLKERIVDISDINKRLIGNLQKKKKMNLSDITENSIIFAPNLTPSETALLNREYTLAFVTDHGGKTSHTAIMARSMDIPAIVGMGDITSYVKSGDLVIVDAVHGEVIINPSKEEIDEYIQYQHDMKVIEDELAQLTSLPSKTLDNIEIRIYGNIEISEEMDTIKSHGAHGIGLFRSEFLFLDKSLPNEETQFCQYKNVADFFYPQPVTIRTLDYGGDKLYGAMRAPKEMNPFLGCRSIRFSLKNQDIFKTQLRAILRASTGKNIKIMYPMISTLDELLQAKEITYSVMKDLDREGIEYDKNIEIGIMVEVPSAVIAGDILAEHVDFFSVGTNDLVQYILAVDRVNETVADLYNPLNISVLRFLKNISDTSSFHSRPISICGEIAGDPKYTMMLIGFGFRELSMNSKNMYQVKKIIRSVTAPECESFAKSILEMKHTKDIENAIAENMKKKFPEMII